MINLVQFSFSFFNLYIYQLILILSPDLFCWLTLDSIYIIYQEIPECATGSIDIQYMYDYQAGHE